MSTIRATRPHHDGDSAPSDYVRFEVDGSVYFADRPWEAMAILLEKGGQDITIQVEPQARELMLAWLNHPERFPHASHDWLGRPQ
jgi:hypothetical protein